MRLKAWLIRNASGFAFAFLYVIILAGLLCGNALLLLDMNRRERISRLCDTIVYLESGGSLTPDCVSVLFNALEHDDDLKEYPELHERMMNYVDRIKERDSTLTNRR